jgi:hypothetical protein
MANYVKATNFTAKDTLPSGDSGKIIKGTEIDTEFTAIASAVASKSNINSPTFTGTPAAPTATTGSNTTQLANTAFVKAAIDDLGTIGTIASQDANAVAVTGGTISGVAITGITDLAVADGGTGASSLTANAVLLGNGTSAVQTVAPSTSGNVLTSNGTTWASTAPAAVAGLGLGGETWQNMAGSRSVGTPYTNGLAYPIQVIVTLVNTAGAFLYINGNLVIRQFYDVNTGAGQVGYSFVSAIIPAGSTYQVIGGNLSTWYELR